MNHRKPWRLPIQRDSRTIAWAFLVIFATAALAIGACNRNTEQSGVYPVTFRASRLPNVTLTDQHGQPVALASLKGKPALFDFIYTSCPGPCQLLTQHMKLIANKLGPDLGQKVVFVSVTVDPEHDRPSRLLDYARALDASEGLVFPDRLPGPDRRVDAGVPCGTLTRHQWGDQSCSGIFSCRSRRP
jgi:cytochrome oxidase Cu insertion factor (SCO1/SenC/PrrC family)